MGRPQGRRVIVNGCHGHARDAATQLFAVCRRSGAGLGKAWAMPHSDATKRRGRASGRRRRRTHAPDES